MGWANLVAVNRVTRGAELLVHGRALLRITGLRANPFTIGCSYALATLMDDFMVRLLADARTGPHFKPANQQRVKEQLVDQLCSLSGGPYVYKGADMKSSHDNLDIKKSDFHALVEVLQASMDAKGTAPRKQNEMLGLLAPMHRDIIKPK